MLLSRPTHAIGLLLALAACTNGPVTEAPASPTPTVHETATSDAPSTTSTTPTTSTTLPTFDQETADSIMSERFPTTTTLFDAEAERESFRDLLIAALEDDLLALDRVETLGLGDGELIISGRTPWVSEDRQPTEQIAIIELIADLFGDTEPHTRMLLLGSETPTITISTASTNGEHPIVTVTDWATLLQLADRRLSSTDWLAAARQ